MVPNIFFSDPFPANVNMASPEDELKQSLNKSLSEDGPDLPTILPWDRFSSWLHCACVVTFDLELGQAMEVRIVDV